MTAIEMLEALAGVGYKACWYNWASGAIAAINLRVINQGDGALLYEVNHKPATREQLEALLEENMSGQPLAALTPF